MVDGACDREATARDAIFKSLADIGRRKHKVVLEITHSYLDKHNKVSRSTEGLVDHVTDAAVPCACSWGDSTGSF